MAQYRNAWPHRPRYRWLGRYVRFFIPALANLTRFVSNRVVTQDIGFFQIEQGGSE